MTPNDMRERAVQILGLVSTATVLQRECPSELLKETWLIDAITAALERVRTETLEELASKFDAGGGLMGEGLELKADFGNYGEIVQLSRRTCNIISEVIRQRGKDEVGNG